MQPTATEVARSWVCVCVLGTWMDPAEVSWFAEWNRVAQGISQEPKSAHFHHLANMSIQLVDLCSDSNAACRCHYCNNLSTVSSKYCNAKTDEKCPTHIKLLCTVTQLIHKAKVTKRLLTITACILF